MGGAGQPMKTGPKPLPLDVRLERNCIPEPNTGCWLWTGVVSPNGYGTTNVGGRHGNTRGAHQAAWQAWRGEIPAGKFVCHHCDVKICINPEHLYLGTPKENYADAIARDRIARGANRNNARFSDDEVQEIRGAAGFGVGYNALGRHYGVDHAHIRKLVRREIWTHVP